MLKSTSPITSEDMKRLSDTSDPTSLSTRFRLKRDIRLRELISNISKRKGSIRILDLGGSVEYWRRVGLDFLHQHRAHVVVLNHIDSELKAADIDGSLFTTVIGDACDLGDVTASEFDLTHSNSVIEHVGNWRRMKQFASEARRVGTSYYIQTPYFWFPVDPHYYRAPLIHWIPRPLQAILITKFNICTAGRISNLDDAYDVLDGTSLLDRRHFQLLFPDAEILSERFMGLTKSLIAIHTG
jgi:hypothetical protein